MNRQGTYHRAGWRMVLCLLIAGSVVSSEAQESVDVPDVVVPELAPKPAPTRTSKPTPAARRPSAQVAANAEQLAALERQLTDLRQTVQDQRVLIETQQDSGRAAESSYANWAARDRSSYNWVRRISIAVVVVWFLFMLTAVFWAVRRFHFTGGLPRKKYEQLVEAVDEDDTIPLYLKEEHYPQNPYKDETFGLPKGTIRGFLTLTLLIINCLILYIGVYAPPTADFDDRVGYMQDAFLVMIAFYFGSKAADLLQNQRQRRSKYDREEPDSDGVDTPVAEGASGGPSPTARVRRPAPVPMDARPATSPEQETGKPPSREVSTKTEGEDLRPIDERVLSLTTYFETGEKIDAALGITAGNFDGQGISFGCLQWNLGQGTLQPILRAFFQSDSSWRGDANLEELFGMIDQPREQQLAWADTIQERQGGKLVLKDSWKETFRELGEGTRSHQLAACKRRFNIARGWCGDWALRSERSLALMFDINVQNGNLDRVIPQRNIDVRRSIGQRITNAGNPTEEEKLVIIAEERAQASLPKWRTLVLDRKLTIARGKGKVYGAEVDLEDFDISIERFFEV